MTPSYMIFYKYSICLIRLDSDTRLNIGKFVLLLSWTHGVSTNDSNNSTYYYNKTNLPTSNQVYESMGKNI